MQTKDLTIPKFHRRVMVFDTETSGLIPRHKAGTPFPPIEAYPYIMQISWTVYNVLTGKIEEVVNEYIAVPNTVEISPEATKVNGITREVLLAKGVPIVPILEKFFVAYMKCDCIVAHNIQFDSEVVRKEMWRNREGLNRKIRNPERVNMMCGVFTKKFNGAYHIETFCTMMSSVELVGIDFVAKPNAKTIVRAILREMVERLVLGDSRENHSIPPLILRSDPVQEPVAKNTSPTSTRKKFPRLNELYSKLFDTPLPGDMHNSIVDVLVCLRCFLKLRGVAEMPENTFLELVDQYSRSLSDETSSVSFVGESNEK